MNTRISYGFLIAVLGFILMVISLFLSLFFLIYGIPIFIIGIIILFNKKEDKIERIKYPRK